MDIYGLSFEQLQTWLVSHEAQPYTAAQIYNWLYVQQSKSFDAMGNLSKLLREKLNQSFEMELPQVVQTQESRDGTVKFLCQMADGKQVETVLLKHDDHSTLCLSTQVGCAMGCKFCLTASMGLVRNLTAGEIISQVLLGQSLLPPGGKLRNLVFMGMGEPFHNYEHLITALKILLDKQGLNYSWRRITVSTSGLTDGIKRFWAETEVSAMLAISLNGVTQAARVALMPVSKKHSLEELLAVAKALPIGKRQRITFEYVLLAGLTDDLISAKGLVALLNGIQAKVNLIPFNEHPELPFRAPTEQQVRAFQRLLLDHGLIATVRRSRGNDVSAACGQLASSQVAKTVNLQQGE